MYEYSCINQCIQRIKFIPDISTMHRHSYTIYKIQNIFSLAMKYVGQYQHPRCTSNKRCVHRLRCILDNTYIFLRTKCFLIIAFLSNTNLLICALHPSLVTRKNRKRSMCMFPRDSLKQFYLTSLHPTRIQNIFVKISENRRCI